MLAPLSPLSLAVIVFAAFARAQEDGSDVYGPNGVALHPNGKATYCLEVNSQVYEAGAPVVSYDCDDGGSRKWLLERGSTEVKVNQHEELCLDAGGGGNGAHVTIQTCNGSPGQRWYYTDDNRLALEGQGQCLDLTDGDVLARYVQTWQCGDGNTNQVWVEEGYTPPAPQPSSVRRSRAHLE